MSGVDKSAKLRDLLRIKKLERTCQFAREIRAEKIEKKLKTTKDKEEKKKLKQDLEILDKIYEKDCTFNGDHANVE